MKISIVVTYLPVDDEVEHLTSECIRRIKAFTYSDFELIRVNNGPAKIGDEDITITNKTNLGNGKAWDQGVGASSGEVVILMDNDVWPLVLDWEKEMVETLQDYSIGMAFPSSILGDDLDKMNSGFVVDSHPRRDGFCFAFRRETYDAVGPFLCDQPFKLGYYEDDHFEARVQYTLGLSLVGCKSSKVWHKGQGTTKKMWSKEVEEGIEANRSWYENRWNKKYPYLVENSQ